MLAVISNNGCAGQEAAQQSQLRPPGQQQSTPQQSSYRSLVQDSQDYQSEEEVDNKFLELERQTLESMMQASSMRSEQDGKQHAQNQKEERASSGAQAGTSTKQAESISWWHSAMARLEQLKEDLGPLEVHQAQAMAKDVTTILTKMINGRVTRGQDPQVRQYAIAAGQMLQFCMHCCTLMSCTLFLVKVSLLRAYCLLMMQGTAASHHSHVSKHHRHCSQLH